MRLTQHANWTQLTCRSWPAFASVCKLTDGLATFCKPDPTYNRLAGHACKWRSAYNQGDPPCL